MAALHCTKGYKKLQSSANALPVCCNELSVALPVFLESHRIGTELKRQDVGLIDGLLTRLHQSARDVVYSCVFKL